MILELKEVILFEIAIVSLALMYFAYGIVSFISWYAKIIIVFYKQFFRSDNKVNLYRILKERDSLFIQVTFFTSIYYKLY